jgi:hypothetical protein
LPDQGQGEIFASGELGKEVVKLKDKAKLVPASTVPVSLLGSCDWLAIQENLSGVGTVEQAEQVKECALPAAGRPHDSHELARPQAKVDPVQDRMPRLPAAETMPKTFASQNHRGFADLVVGNHCGVTIGPLCVCGYHLIKSLLHGSIKLPDAKHRKFGA